MLAQLDTTKKQILIIDDDSSVRDALEKVLAGTGYKVELAANGTAGLAKLNELYFDLLLLDLNLPDLTGFDILDVAAERTPLVPVIILTGEAEQCAPGSLAGAAALLNKPVDVLELLKTIEQVLAQPAESRLPGDSDSPLGTRREPIIGSAPMRASALWRRLGSAAGLSKPAGT
jgi:DNA-binding NtrC family response regulator